MQERFVPILTEGLDKKSRLQAVRLNCLGSLFYFIKIALRRTKMTENLHLPVCQHFERERIKDVYEFPRDHFKSTICSEGMPIWYTLPVSPTDENTFLKLGYSDEFVRWMHTIHNPLKRNLLVSENITNSAKLGGRIRWHFESNSLFRALFHEILPTTAEKWSDYSLHINRAPFMGNQASHGEGTYDFLGVGGALQSRHYDGIVIQDDLVGKKAIESQTVMDKTIEYHQLLIGAFENEDKDHENNELIVGNRWSFYDLNAWVRENEPWWSVTSHSALGGCCEKHTEGQPIFPEQWSVAKLSKVKRRLGSYHFSCQYLNDPTAPEDADFRMEWLNYYRFEMDDVGHWSILHETKNGTVRKDLKIGHLTVAMAVDPNHAGNQAAGRSRHAIIVVGQSHDGHYYLLDCWAKHGSYDTLVGKIFEVGKQWKLHKIGLETVAAQKYLAYHLLYRSRIEKRTLRIQELNGEVEAPDGTLTKKKGWRIRNVLSPIFEQNRFWVQRRHLDFIREFKQFPKGKYVDILDALAYIPQLLKSGYSQKEFEAMLRNNQARARKVNQPYCLPVS